MIQRMTVCPACHSHLIEQADDTLCPNCNKIVYCRPVQKTCTERDGSAFEYEYCGDAVYDRRQWRLDRSFSAAVGQEVTPEIYNIMLDCMPPKDLPRIPETEGFRAGFLVGEPYSFEDGKPTYSAFGRIGKRCFFLGYLPAR